ncbi:MAG: NADH-quinone oxidoreductase subunit K [Armatimonadota bacterium]
MSEISTISTPVVLGISLALFLIGLLGVMVRRDLLFVLMSLEIMLNAAGLAFTAEVGVGLSLVLRLYHRFDTVDGDEISLMRG